MKARVGVERARVRAGEGSSRVGSESVIWVLFAGTLLVRSLGFAYPFLAYHAAGRGQGVQAVGVILAGFGVGLIAGQLLGGWLVDHVGRRRTVLATMALCAVALALLAEADGFFLLLMGAIVVGIVYDAPRPVLGAAITQLIPDPARRAKFDAWRLGFIVNGGAAIAGAAGVLLADRTGLPMLFWINATACAAFALLAFFCLPSDGPGRVVRASPTSFRPAFADRRMLAVFVASAAILTAVAGLYSAIPMIMTARGISASAYGLTQLTDAVAVVVLTPLIGPWLSRKLAVRPRVDIVAASAVWVVAMMALAALADTAVQFAALVALAAPAVIAWFVGINDIVHRIAPPAALGSYHGAWGAAGAVAAVIAPILAGFSLAHGGYGLVAVTTLAVGVAGSTLYVPLHRALARAGVARDPDGSHR